MEDDRGTKDCSGTARHDANNTPRGGVVESFEDKEGERQQRPERGETEHRQEEEEHRQEEEEEHRREEAHQALQQPNPPRTPPRPPAARVRGRRPASPRAGTRMNTGRVVGSGDGTAADAKGATMFGYRGLPVLDENNEGEGGVIYSSPETIRGFEWKDKGRCRGSSLSSTVQPLQFPLHPSRHRDTSNQQLLEQQQQRQQRYGQPRQRCEHEEEDACGDIEEEDDDDSDGGTGECPCKMCQNHGSPHCCWSRQTTLVQSPPPLHRQMNGDQLKRDDGEEGEEKEKGQQQEEEEEQRDRYALLEMSKEIEGLVGVTSSEYQRYERGVVYDKEYLEENIPPFTRHFGRPAPPSQWTMYAHPEGMPYFLKNTYPLPVLTDAYVYESATRDRVEQLVEQITLYMERNGVLAVLGLSLTPPDATAGLAKTRPPTIYLVLEQRRTGMWGYYFVDHENRCLFWLDKFNFTHFVDEVKIKHTMPHMGLEMRSQYWWHNELFPHVYELTEENVHELEDMLVFATGDVLTSGSNSTVNEELEDLKLKMTMVQHFQHKSPHLQYKSAGGARFLFRLLSAFYHERFLHLYSEKGARLQPSQSIHATEKDSALVRIISPVMLYGPTMLINKLNAITVDQLVGKRGWVKFKDTMLEEWRDITLYATVILNANVAFLAIQSVDTAALPGRRTDSQRASYFSIVTSMGTIVLGLYFLRQHRETMTFDFIANRSATRVGLDTLALMYSLPYVLLMWSMISFVVSFAILWYQSKDTTVVTLVSVTWGIVAILLLWGISSANERAPYWSMWPLRQVQRFKKSVMPAKPQETNSEKRPSAASADTARDGVNSDKLARRSTSSSFGLLSGKVGSFMERTRTKSTLKTESRLSGSGDLEWSV